ncbi:iron transporter FeoB [Kosmotoga arenicorallina S304]|uniref:Ferrous iron transport protein B n=1 Tax=Kosmotoga arenicorallina S304 TaxID=1453497 RepID=A0A176K153_9BACT|nr:ferrous iron transport protein B [Kosmotoga arenicorallina]OAA30426.1 iron transporter FeoB [Kosmotoga arenicorallina S304]
MGSCPSNNLTETNTVVPAKYTSVALLGNPNVGKTSLFNALTGARQYVANWPGVTIEKRVGTLFYGDRSFRIIDLPGTYTLGATSIDEKVARDYLLYESPDLVVVVTDALNLERSLYLLLQVLELRGNVILAINSIDEAKKAGIRIDSKELSKHLGIPVVLTSAFTGEGIENLKEAMLKISRSGIHVHYLFPDHIEGLISKLSSSLKLKNELRNFDSRWLSIKILERDKEVMELTGIDPDVDYSADIANARYEFIKELLKDSYRDSKKHYWDLNTAIDHVITHKYLGILIFFAIMYLVFQITYGFAEPFTTLIEKGFDTLGAFVDKSIPIPWLASLLSDGVIGGVGAVITFVPSIFILFLALGVLEETGYLPRAAFVVDRIMYSMKLSGRSFMSMLLGFGCNVSSIMSTRTISEPQERIVTILVSPFISCSARLPVYIMIASIFFGKAAGLAIFSLYVLSVLFTFGSALLFNKLLFKGKPSPMIMELPRYRKPTLRSLMLYTWNRGKHFLEKAGTIILAASIVIWLLSYFPTGDILTSFASVLGKSLEPLFRPLGFTWQMVTSLIFGGAAKEVIVSSLSTLYGATLLPGISGLAVLSSQINPAVAFGFLVFVLLYFPCFATIAAIKNESGSWKYVWITVLYGFGVAYLLALVIKLIGGAFL